MTTGQTLGQYLKIAREDAGFESAEAAEKAAEARGLRIRARSIRQIEADKAMPKAETLRLLTELYGMESMTAFRIAGYLPGEVDAEDAAEEPPDLEDFIALYDSLDPSSREGLWLIVQGAAALQKARRVGQRPARA